MNVLVLSCGTRVKIVRYAKENAGGGRVVATDCSPLAPALYEADAHYIVPRITDETYIDVILDICKKEKIDAAFSLIDPELSLLAKHAEAFQALGVLLIGSGYEQCEITLNKYEMFKRMAEKGYRCARSYVDREAFERDRRAGLIDYPVFVKPVSGSASIAVSKVEDERQLEYLLSRHRDLMIQELLNGQEIGADCYIDLVSGETVSIFTKRKLLMRSGETDKAVSFKDERLFALIERFIADFGFKGQIDIDIFDVGGEYYFSEVNPRFGGGYPHAYACGVNHMRLIAENVRGLANGKNIGGYEDGVYMMKYVDVAIGKNLMDD